MHSQTRSNSFFQIKRQGPLPPGARPQASPAGAVCQLGRPVAGAPSVGKPVALKLDSIQTSSQNGNSSGQAIDLTLDDDDEEEDEPMGEAQLDQPTAPATTDTSSTASDAVKLSLFDGPGNDAATVAQLEATDMMAPLVEDAESDIDEEWPSVPAPANEQASREQTGENVDSALDAIRKTVPIASDEQKVKAAEVKAQLEQSATSPLYGGDSEEMEADVAEELPKEAAKTEEDVSGSVERIIRVEHLEDGEIFEEGSAYKAGLQAQRTVMLEHQTDQLDAQPVDAMDMRPHLRNKKQKKRGKKKAKRKLEAMQMMRTLQGEMAPEFERVTRQRPFGNMPPPGQYTLAMMRNGPRGEPMNMRPVFQDPPPFRPGNVFVAHPQMRPPPMQATAPPLPPPYDDSQILRVNRQGSMEMFDGEPDIQHMMLSEPPKYGGFKYRSVSMSPPLPMAGRPCQPLQRSVSNNESHLSTSSVSLSKPIPSKEREISDDFDLDSLRAAALRTKTKRPGKPSTPTTQKAMNLHSSASSPSSSPRLEEKQSEPESPEIDELRLEILRSMQRNRKRTANKAADKVSTPMQLIDGAGGAKTPDQSSIVSGNKNDTAVDDKSPPGNTKSSNANEEPMPADSSAGEHIAADGSSETDKSTSASEKNESEKTCTPASTLDTAKAPAEVKVMTPEFRPLTACSQSLVIRLNPEDFSPRKGGDDAHASSKVTSTYQDAIKEMRRKIAEREKKQLTNRLLESTAAKLSEPRSFSSPASLSSSPHQLEKTKRVAADTIVMVQGGKSSSFEMVKGLPTVKTKAETKIKESIRETSEVQASKEEHNLVKDASPVSVQHPETTAEQASSTGRNKGDLGKLALERQEQSDTSRVSTFVDTHTLPSVLLHQVPASSDGRNRDPASEPCVKKSIEPVAAT
ncbi:unnamed protein product [Phytophthora lilii]|uniref:Unnamed protein product n=1 Tax=Phytophthora lilii TaxID=2077276 RepID=A0A9W6X4X7_9STRA|nr:unnamed protein product [Phytophthora lilii]